jgi:endonuclease III
MRRTERATIILEILNREFPNPAVPLDHRNTFTFLVAVMLSASATDKKVNQVTPILFDLADSPEKMSQLSILQIKNIIHDVGLSNSKSKNIHRMAELLLERHAGEVPSSFEELEALPGVGHKTASVVISQSFGRPAFAVDTHIHRLSYRWGISNGSSVKQTEKDLKQHFDERNWNLLHLQMIYFGRKFCPALRHDVDACPICSWAITKKRQKEEIGRTAPWQPRPKKKKTK